MKHNTKLRKEKWVSDAEKWATNKFELIFDEYVCEEFVEFHGSIGGDMLTYRYRKDGSISER